MNQSSPVKLTIRQQQVLRLLEAGMTTEQISVRLNLSKRTVQYHIKSLRKRFRAATRAQITSRAARRQITTQSKRSAD